MIMINGRNILIAGYPSPGQPLNNINRISPRVRSGFRVQKKAVYDIRELAIIGHWSDNESHVPVGLNHVEIDMRKNIST